MMNINEFASKLNKYMQEHPEFDILEEDNYEILIKMLSSDFEAAIRKLAEENEDGQN